VVTGGSRGIGATAAAELAANGASVAVVGRDEAALSATVATIEQGGGRAVAVRADCTREADLRRLATTVADTLGPVDILAPFAGGGGNPVPTAKETAEHWRDVVESNLTATLLTVTAFLPGMLERRRGVIVLMASSAGRQASGSSAAYAAAKAGVVALGRHLANEVAADGIRVNCLAPSTIENERLRRWLSADDRRRLADDYPLRRLGRPEDVAGAVLFFAGSEAAFVTGQVLYVCGGASVGTLVI